MVAISGLPVVDTAAGDGACIGSLDRVFALRHEADVQPRCGGCAFGEQEANNAVLSETGRFFTLIIEDFLYADGMTDRLVEAPGSGDIGNRELEMVKHAGAFVLRGRDVG